DQQNAGGPWAPQPGMPPSPGWAPAPDAYQGGAPQLDPANPAANPAAEPARPGEPGEATAWPPRLPGEPYPQGQAPTGSSWPPADAYHNEPTPTRVLEAPAGDPPGAGESGGTPGAELVPIGTPQDTAAPAGEQPDGAGTESHQTQHLSFDRTTQPLPQPEEPLQPPAQTPDAQGQAPGDAPSGTSGPQDEAPAATASQSPSEAAPEDVPPSAAPQGAASSDTPPTDPSTSGGGTGADSPDPQGQMATTSPTTGSPSQPTGETPFAFTPVKPARAGKPAPPPGFGPPPSTPVSNLPASLTSADPQRSGGKITRILLAAGAVVVVGAIGTAAYFAYSGESDSGRAAPTATATTAPPVEEPQPSPTAASSILDSEQTDPKTLKAEEAFPDEKVTLAGRTYRRVKIDVTDDCEKAATGAFAKALAEQQCRRVLRATYVDGKRQYAVTAGIAVLPGKTEALTVNQTKDLNANVWFRGLNGDKASGADKVSISGGYAAGMVWGRYIVFSYATYADGHNPDANDTTLGPISSAFRDNMAKVIEKRASR
ncbi:MAG: hypothetical protein IRZ07_05430, partial [Microbispora sp.]|nr:hypothetical protein [Microbispora sp.]